MTVRLYEWDKTETGWAWIEITDNKVVNLKLREEDNLIKINDDDEAYVDLQLEDWITPSDDMPVWVDTGRILQGDWWLATWTILVAKTTSWDELSFFFADDWKLYTDNWTGTFKQIYLKWDVDALFQALATVAHTGDYDDLINKPVLWTAASKDVGTNPWNVPVIWSNWKLDGNIVPSVWVMNVYTVATLWDLTTLSQAVQWDIGVVTNDNKTYILSADPYSVLSNWVELRFPTWAVSSVNWQTWAVTLTTFDINEAWDSLYCTTAEKTAWNNKLDASDVSTVALTGSFSDLTWTPVVDSTLSTSSTNAIQNWAVATAVDSINSDISDLQTAIGWASGDISDIQWDITTIELNITNLTTTVNGLVSDSAFSSAWDWDTTHAPSKNAVYDEMEKKQDTLVSWTNIKTINNESLLWSGNIDITSIVLNGGSTGTFLKAAQQAGTKHTIDMGTNTTYTFQGVGYVLIKSWMGWACTINGVELFYEYHDGWTYTIKEPATIITMGPWDVVRLWRPWSRWNCSYEVADYY